MASVGTAAILLVAPPAPTTDSCVAVSPGPALAVPVDFIGGRFFGRWPRRTSGALRFYLDTGGGFNMLAPNTIRRLGLAPDSKVIEGDTITWVRIPHARAMQPFPAIPSDERFAGTRPEDPGAIRLLAAPPSGMWKNFELDSVRVDGLLGPVWFADRVWTMDYPNGRLYFHGTDPVVSIPSHCWVPLGFQTDSTGQRTMNFPRITAVVDGDSVDFLFDTGAMTTVSDNGWRLGEPGARRLRATSFIITTRLERWHARHPDWPLISDAERGSGVSRMIQVPVIEVGGQRIGPVWFTERSDGNFRFFSQWMDRRVDGALGGSAWRSVTIVLDYPRSRAAVLKAAGDR